MREREGFYYYKLLYKEQYHICFPQDNSETSFTTTIPIPLQAMAPSPKHLSLLITVLLLISSLQVQARESKFFSKTVHSNTAKESFPLKSPAPSPNQEDPFNYTQENQNGYGLYGHESDQASPTTTFNNVEYTARDTPSEFSTVEFTTPTTPTTTTTTTNTNERSYMNKEYSTTKYPTNEFEKQQYGMSDTRFLNNGRYFYDVNTNNNYGSRYETGKSNQRYGSYGDMSKYNNGGYYGNNENAYEYNSSLDGYKGSQEEEEDFVP